eukprot:scaffold270539_cov29-Prasinocladus_malaysianus.AAC.1
MGISGFHSWMKARYPDAYEPVGEMQVDHLYIDLSSTLHTVVRKSEAPSSLPSPIHGCFLVDSTAAII